MFSLLLASTVDRPKKCPKLQLDHQASGQTHKESQKSEGYQDEQGELDKAKKCLNLKIDGQISRQDSQTVTNDDVARWIIKDTDPLISRDKELKKRPSVFVDDKGGVHDDINNISAA